VSEPKYNFVNDYSELAHPRILEAFAAVGSKQFAGYGLDEYCQRAAELIKVKIEMPGSDVHFVSGGTQSNTIVLSALLRPHEAVISTTLGHINTHETGAIEATGHKVCTAAHVDGKLTPAAIQSVVDYHSDEHMVKPRAVYISQSTELGSVYTASELTAINTCCRDNDLYLFADGARLGAAMNSVVSDLTYAQFASLVDVFYIGGTKNGGLYGEAVVICNEELQKDFRFYLKQRGAMLAKGAGMGIQFEVLFKDGLYDELAAHADRLAYKLATGITELGYRLLSPIQSNQVFPVFPVDVIQQLRTLYGFQNWEDFGDTQAIRLVTSWATPEEMVDMFIEDLTKLSV